jgi:AcrR family transcriptional regulator
MATGDITKDERQPSARREEILRIAAGVLAENGLRGSTIRQIAERANMLSGSLYYHFDSKDAMAIEVIQAYWEEIIAAYDRVVAEVEDPVERIRALFIASLDVSNNRRHEVLILHQDWHLLKDMDDEIRESMDRLEGYWYAALEEGIAQGKFRADLDPRVVYRAMMGAISWVPRWYDPAGDMSLDEISGIQAELMITGLLSNR